VIADIISCLAAGIGVGRLFVRRGFLARLNSVMTQNRSRRRDQCREWNTSPPNNVS
jgi:hypothetical protein